VVEHDATRRKEAADQGNEDGGAGGVEQVLDLGFGKCKLQVQVPEKGRIASARDLVGGNVVTSFVGLTGEYFRGLEDGGGKGFNGVVDGEWEGAGGRKMKTRIKYVGGSVEAACALGVADGIVDLVGMCSFLLASFSLGHPNPYISLPFGIAHYSDLDASCFYIQTTTRAHKLISRETRIGRNDESSRPESDRYGGNQHRRPDQIEKTLEPRSGGIDRKSNQWGDKYVFSTPPSPLLSFALQPPYTTPPLSPHPLVDFNTAPNPPQPPKNTSSARTTSRAPCSPPPPR